MSSHSPSRVQSFKATAAIVRGLCVKAGADREHIAVGAAATDKLIGISNSTATAAEEMIEVCLPGAGAKAKLGGSASFGDLLTFGTGGKLVATTTPGDRYIAMAMEDGVENDLIAVEVVAGLI